METNRSTDLSSKPAYPDRPDFTQSDSARTDLDEARYIKVRRFFALAFIQILWFDIILNRPVMRWFRTPALPRWQAIAIKYRDLALSMGGVLIKLGQFLSTRVDILPREITGELAGLQDEVPTEKAEDIIALIETDFNRPITATFDFFDPKPVGAASLAQVHRVRLSKSAEAAEGIEAVVKVLRPGINLLVETDLAAIGLAFRWLKFYKPIRERIDLDWLYEEFTTVTRKELDLKAEGQNAERLATDLADNPHVCFPKIYWDYCAAHTLTMENVAYIKITDVNAIKAAGISNVSVADTLHAVYMQQVFETHFVHVDPHPGNLFIKPMPSADEIEAGITEFGPHDTPPYRKNRTFQIVFVDFGMMVYTPERLRAALREFAIGFGTRDAHKIVQSFVHAGALTADADLKRLEEVHEVLFERFWGVRVGQIQQAILDQAGYFLREYRDLLFDAPFQLQADMMFIMRAIGILSGIATHLDPDFDPWAKTIPYAERYAGEDIKQEWQGWAHEAAELGHRLSGLPSQLEQVLSMIRRDKLIIRSAFAPDTRKSAQRLERAVTRLGWMVLSGATLISGVQVYVSGRGNKFSGLLFFMAICFFLQSRRK
ncbi:AarF/UbiB family protein [Desulfococcaceae bacterium HSG7]|nr:AarF/UbiB family protein [Desulfococcaceae bacterium HSG7]